MDSIASQARHYKTLQEMYKKPKPNQDAVRQILDLEFQSRRAFIDCDVLREEDRATKILEAYPCFKEIHNVMDELWRILDKGNLTFLTELKKRWEHFCSMVQFYGVWKKVLKPPKNLDGVEEKIAQFRALPTLFPSPVAPPKKLGHASEALLHVLQPAEDPAVYLQRRSFFSPVLVLDESRCLLAIGTTPITTFAKEDLGEGSSVHGAEFGLLPDNITVLEGDSVILRCRIDEEVTHKAWLNRSNILFTGTDKWSLDKRVTLLNSNNSDFSIHIEKVQITDEGPYTCTFQANNKPRIAHVYLIVQVPARIVNISKNVSVNEGENVNLFCLAVGRPEPTVTWKDQKYGLVSEGEFLDITEIKRQQAEDYECITHNGVAPPDQRKVKVTVNYPPTIIDMKNMPAHLGKTAVLRCDAMAVPPASFEWYRDDHRPVENDNTLRIKNEKTRSLLLFTNVTEKHFGNYTCFASNRLGSSNASMLLFRPGALQGRGTGLRAGMSVSVWLSLFAVLLKV